MHQNAKPWILPLIALVLVSTGTMIVFDRPLIRGDGTAYLAWLDTFVRDRDIDLANQHARLQPVNTYQITWDQDLERYVNIFPFGVAILQAPAYGVGAVLTSQGIANQNSAYFLNMQGVNQGYSVAVMFGANAMALAAIVIAWQITRKLVGNWTAAFFAWVFFVGTPLLYYSTISPLNSHNPGAFLVAGLLWIMLTYIVPLTRPPGDPARGEIPHVPFGVWITVGIVAGLAVLVRWQLAAVVALAWLLMAAERRHWPGLLVATGVAAVVMLPLPVIWNAMFGDPFVVPYDETTGQSFLGWPVNAHRVLWNMTTHSPLMVLSLAGAFFLWRIDWRWAVFCLASVGVEVLINGSTADWYAGDSYGPRRMSELYPIYVLLAGALAGTLSPGRPHWQHVRPLLVRGLVTVLLAYAILLLMAFMVFTWTNPERFFADDPDVMIDYFFDHEDSMGVIDVIFETHLGPRAWSKPGP